MNYLYSLILIFILNLYFYSNCIAQNWTQEEKVMIAIVDELSYQKYGKSSWLTLEEWIGLYDIYPEGVDFYIQRSGLKGPDLFELNQIIHIKDSLSRTTKLNYFETKHPEYKKILIEKPWKVANMDSLSTAWRKAGDEFDKLFPKSEKAFEWTPEKKTVLARLIEFSFREYGQSIWLTPREWNELYIIYPEGVNLMGEIIGLSGLDYLKLCYIYEIKNLDEQKIALKQFESEHPVFQKVSYEKSWESKSNRFNEIKEIFNDRDPELAKRFFQYDIEEYNLDNITLDNINLIDVLPNRFKDSFPEYIKFLEKFNQPYMINEFGFLNSVNDTDNYVYNSGTAKSLIDQSNTIYLYNEVLKRKAKNLIIQRNYKSQIYSSNDTILINLLNTWQEKVELYRATTMDRFGKSSSQWVEDVKNVGMQEAYGELRRSLPIPKIPNHNWEEIRDNLKTDEAAIEIIRFHENISKNIIKYAILIIRKEYLQPELLILENGYKLETVLFKKYKMNLEKYKLEDSLYHEYWGKIQQKLFGIKKVYLAPDGIFNIINLNIFPAPNNLDGLLINHLDIRYLVSTRGLIKDSNTLFLPFKDSTINSDITIVGAPNFNLNIDNNRPYSENYIPLEYSLEEVKFVNKIYKDNGKKAFILTGDLASENKFKSINSPIIHVASHGFFNKSKVDEIYDNNEIKSVSFMENFMSDFGMLNRKSDAFTRTGIALSGANFNNETYKNEYILDEGILLASEIEHLNLNNTDLVFLNICDSGKGDQSYGEGVFGLQRAFISAGSECVITSQTSVADDIGRDFALIFYNNLIIEKQNHSEAFRNAQIELNNYLGKGTPLSLLGNYKMICI